MPGTQYEAIRRAKAYRSAVSHNALLDFGGALDIAMSDTIDSDFLDTPSKNAILTLIDDSRQTFMQPPDVDVANRAVSPDRSQLERRLVAISAATGVLAAGVSSAPFFDLFTKAIAANSSAALFAAFVVATVAVTAALALWVSRFPKPSRIDDELSIKARLALRDKTP